MPAAPSLRRTVIVAAVVIATIALAVVTWWSMRDTGPGPGFASGNGRIEATEIDVSTKLAGRIDSVLVDEGDFLRAGQPLAQMNTDVLDAQRAEAAAAQDQAIQGVNAGEAQVTLRQADVAAAEALTNQRESERDAASRRFARSSSLTREGASSEQELDDDRARLRSADAAVAAARAQTAATRAAVAAAKAQLVGARSNVIAAAATVRRISADITDAALVSPRDGRVQFRVAEPGEVLPAGGKVLNLVDLSDVYMTFFLPEADAGKVALGSDVRLILDVAPQYVIPATVSFVADTAQFTPKTVETASERQKLMFRVRAKIAPALLRKHLAQVKTGLPGVAWVKTDPSLAWPAALAIKVPR
jgi:HlyD family secretion protein